MSDKGAIPLSTIVFQQTVGDWNWTGTVKNSRELLKQTISGGIITNLFALTLLRYPPTEYSLKNAIKRGIGVNETHKKFITAKKTFRETLYLFRGENNCRFTIGTVSSRKRAEIFKGNTRKLNELLGFTISVLNNQNNGPKFSASIFLEH